MSGLYLGIDIGTSKAAAVIADPGGTVHASASQPHEADLPGPPERSEQDPGPLLATAWSVVQALPAALRREVAGIGVTGQMHGVVLLDEHGVPLGPLVTWQDQRAMESPDFLPRLQDRTGHTLRTGFGCATLAWWAARGELPARAASAGAVLDMAVAWLCGSGGLTMDPTGAASWGLFDLAAMEWDFPAAEAAGIPSHLLPSVVPCGATAGRLAAEVAAELGLSAGIPVAAAIGDNQASLLATLRDPAHDLALTLGTGGQVSAVMDSAPAPEQLAAARRAGGRWEYRPFPGGRFAVVAASLCGGSAWAWLGDTVRMWLGDLGRKAPDAGELLDRLSALGLRADHEVTVHPHFLGERCDPLRRGAIADIGLDNLTLGALARGLARGILTTLHDLFPEHALAGRRRIVGSGNALRRTPLLQFMAEKVFGLPLVLPDGREEAATGAALIASRAAGSGAG